VEHIVANARAASWKLSQEEVIEIRAMLGDEERTWESSIFNFALFAGKIRLKMQGGFWTTP
jgi:diketogulonate reductase-like aldo/keto reductase